MSIALLKATYNYAEGNVKMRECHYHNCKREGVDVRYARAKPDQRWYQGLCFCRGHLSLYDKALKNKDKFKFLIRYYNMGNHNGSIVDLKIRRRNAKD